MQRPDGSRRSRRVLPSLLALPFVVAVAVDVVRMIAGAPAPVLDLLEVGELRFEPEDPVFDLRLRAAADRVAWSEPGFVRARGWGETGAGGSWTTGPSAELVFEIARPGQRVLFVEGRADGHGDVRPDLALEVNGADCGRLPIGRTIGPLRFEISDGLLRRGPNTLELRLVGGPEGRLAGGRTALVRRVALASDEHTSFHDLVAGTQLSIARDRGAVVIRRPGRLVMSFVTRSSGSELSCRVRLLHPRTRVTARLVVARRFEGPDRFDVIRTRTVGAARPRSVLLRQELRDRGESCALLVEVDRAAAEGGVALRELRVAAKPRAGG